MALRVENNESRKQPKSPRPEAVPPLELRDLVGEVPEDKSLENPIKKKHAIHSPTPQSAVSWGSQLSPPYALTSKDMKFGGTVYRPCSHIGHHADKNQPQQKNHTTQKAYQEKRHYPSNKYEDKKKEQNFHSNPPKVSNEAVKRPNKVTIAETHKTNIKSSGIANQGVSGIKAANKNKYWYLDEELQNKPPSPEPVDTGYTVDEMAQMQAKYTSQPYSGLHGARKFAAEDDLIKKQKEEIMEQVLIDQLSRHVLSDVEQDCDPARKNPADPASNFNTAPLRFRTRRLHESKVSTAGAVTESKLRDKITFGVRLVTRDGRDALRELFGFYFHADKSLTIYEFRLFGKNTTKALPAIGRGKYCHIVGRRKGKEYESGDFQLGRNLTFLTKKQNHLPDSLKKHPVITMRVCETSTQQFVNTWDIQSSDRDGGNDTALERKDRKITTDVQNFIRNKLRDRSVSVLVGLGRLFRQLDSSGDGVLNKEELKLALEEFDVALPLADFDAVWRVVDENDDGAIDYGEFIRAFIGEMNEPRKLIVRKVFKKLDPHKTGSAKFLDLQKLYSAKKHPLVVAGKFKQSEMEEQFLTSLSDICLGSEVTFIAFEEYYEGLSIVVEKDEDFINMMRNCWGV